MRTYTAMIAALDDAGIADETIVVFASDGAGGGGLPSRFAGGDRTRRLVLR